MIGAIDVYWRVVNVCPRIDASRSEANVRRSISFGIHSYKYGIEKYKLCVCLSSGREDDKDGGGGVG